ncbi:CDP-alcohol phosphatidyltransferase family protein [Marinobacter sp. CHS3-4]|uniref:CDP-alcohol phosphatidyltransferase family protein n=1 Tax=Marinobacter sp. CHS3-4 TaxID=3045174 RepID=UPI0024B52A70|nr:CDP-alcohol phosphatidyltransferase family protein [Marinobacter sp. CHS3-4]MDI9245609.1 CDP-alcohol phosphatidyltransferase family protein [Marinobacter sp. CHS3-4]
MDSRTVRTSLPLLADMLIGGLWLLLLISVLGSLFDPGFTFYPISIALSAGCVFFIYRHWPAHEDFGWANRVTLFRGLLVFSLFGLAPFLGPDSNGNLLWVFVSLSLIALLLDGVDGHVARATATESRFGARFDMELDALFILGLCVAVISLDRAALWVLALGLLRYGFVVAGMVWPALQAPLPESLRRKTVCVWQLVTLMVAILPITPAALAQSSLILALVLLVYSFGTDIRWLVKTRRSL